MLLLASNEKEIATAGWRGNHAELISKWGRRLHRLVSFSEISSADILIFKAPNGAQSAEATELAAVSESRTAPATVSRLTRRQCDHRTHGQNTRRAGRDPAEE